MFRSLLFCLALLLSPGLLPAQQQVQAFSWLSKKLEWSDFQEDNSTEKYGSSLARSYWKLDVSDVDTAAMHRTGYARIRITAYFVPSRSWARRSSIGNASILAHEQLHFDIVELFARQLRKKLAETPLTPSNYNKVVQRLKKTSFSRMQAMQEKYDATHRQRWNQWVTEVANGIAALEAFSTEEVQIPVRIKH